MEWQEPKTDWLPEDRFNITDYNRIKNNLIYIWEQAALIWGDFQIEDMGRDLTPEDADNAIRWDVDVFNAFEINVDIINEHMLSQDYGNRQSFYDNGPFIKWPELNRIEYAILRMKRIVDGRKASLVRLSFRFGAPNGLKL